VPEQSPLHPAVFLDRDGTIAEEVGYLNHASRFRMFPFVAAAIQRLNEAGLPVIVVTNQSGVGRGYFPESLVHTVNELMTRQLAEVGAIIVRTYPPEIAAAASQKPACWTVRPRSSISTYNAPSWLATAMATWNSREMPGRGVSSCAPGTVKVNSPGTLRIGPRNPTLSRKILRKRQTGF
jgi:HAD superfamily hydrolase (TIGR01662 family)